MPVVVVTDSTASLPTRVVAEHGILVVPLQVVIGAQVYDEVLEAGEAPKRSGGATPAMVAEALKEFRPVSTSRPTPSALLEVYERAAAAGADEIVSVHLSGEMSGTFESAQLAARDASIPVHPVDSRQVGVATGYAALSAAEVLARGRDGARRGRGGPRTGGPGDLAVLRRHPGVPAPGRPDRRRRGDLRRSPVGEAAAADRRRQGGQPREGAHRQQGAQPPRGPGPRGGRRPAPVDVCVAHLASPDRAEQLAERLADELAEHLGGREVWCSELGAVLGAHVGPGMVAVCVAPLPV